MKCPLCQTIIKPDEYEKHFGAVGVKDKVPTNPPVDFIDGA